MGDVKVVCNLHTKVVEKWQTAKSFSHFFDNQSSTRCDAVTL